MNYPTATELSAMGETLQRDVCLWSALLAHEYRTPPCTPVTARPDGLTVRSHKKRNHNKQKGSAPRTFRSRYVGVTIHRDRWLAQWGPRGVTKSAVFPLTPEGERMAAEARAKALGLDYIETRPLELVRPAPVPHASMSERGPAKKHLGGKRIA